MGVVMAGAITVVEATTTAGVVAIITGIAIGDTSTRLMLGHSEEAAFGRLFLFAIVGLPWCMSPIGT
jgi:hypothetical protein